MPNGSYLKWNERKFKNGLLDMLEERAEYVGEFGESEARKNLLSISDPEWGRAYRREIVARLITYVVQRKRNEVVVLVGVAKSKSGKHHGFYIELGSMTAPAQPFLRPAIFGNGRKIVSLIVS